MPGSDIIVKDEDASFSQKSSESEEKPQNHGPTFKFHTLYQDLFNPLIENRKKPTGAQVVRGRQAGPHGPPKKNTHEERRQIIDRFFSRWRREVGDNIFPALRLILPEKDRDRAMYGLKEKVLARYIVKIMKIDKNSEDAYSLTHWKRPGQTSDTAGDFAQRVYDVVKKRALRIEPGDLTIADVNSMLGELSVDPKEESQLPIMEKFYQQMNAEEMMWLIRIILRSMRVGATEKTFLDIWHPDAETLFNICSSLKRVCEELYKPDIRLEKDERGVSLMACYQPQLAYFNMQKQSSFNSMITSMKLTEDDQEFWIEEKLDGERMQLHMVADPEVEGGRSFKFWSRKAKEYTYLYGSTLRDPNGSLTRHLENAFADGVENIILDGEMITWDPELDVMVPFGTLKTAALSEIKDSSRGGNRPFYRVFDILYLNDTDITRYTLRDRYRALLASVKNNHRRMEILEHTIGKTAADIEDRLQNVIEQASEGLLLKNPRSSYTLADRRDDWVKVKPEYMSEFGESLDCIVIGGFYGSGHRGGMLSSFLCGLRDDRKSKDHASTSGETEKSTRFISFFKVGGGMTRDDYRAIQHQTEGKWHDWDPKRPPLDLFELAGGANPVEPPDQWIHPKDSLVVEVRAASVNPSDDYAMGITLRFPRFARFRQDRDWQTALSVQEFRNLKESVEEQREENKQKRAQEVAQRRNAKSGPSRAKKPLTVAGYNARNTNNIQTVQETGHVFQGMTIYIMTESKAPEKKSKLELEELVRANGGRIVQSADIKSDDKRKNIDVICIADRRTVKVASLIKRGNNVVVKPIWLFDCIEQGRRDFARGFNEMVLQYEIPRHIFFAPDESRHAYEENVDANGDSYTRDTTIEELQIIISNMTTASTTTTSGSNDQIRAALQEDSADSRGNMFATLRMYFASASSDQITNPTDHNKSSSSVSANHNNPTAHKHESTQQLASAKRKVEFSGATTSTDLHDPTITHIIAMPGSNIQQIRKTVSARAADHKKIPRIVKLEWITDCWEEKTRIDEEKYTPH